ncbi:Eukaryotic peptide chain release factor subunit 1-2, partial [Dictyocoela roeselum]
LRACDILLPRIRDKIIKVVDTNYGGENGLNQAIDMTKDVLKDLKLTKEKEVLQRFFLEIATNTHKYVFGPETIRYLEMQVIDTLIVCEEIDLLHNDEPFIDFIADHYKEMNINLHFVSSRTPEGEQFVQGFGGIGGILRYRMVDENEEEYESVSESDLF